MASYLLLRNNTKSGPLSIDDLLKCGLKPYDLVWIEGKSAAWRYPSEIEELKPYAPAVEEQPFDRFFKKPSPQSKETYHQPQTTEKAEEKPIVQDIIQQEKAIEEKYEKYIPKKSVFVTMPGQAAKTAQHSQSSQNGYNGQSNNQSTGQHTDNNTLNNQYAQKATTTQQVQPVSQYQPVPEPEPAPVPTISVTENPEAAKIKFSQPLDEIKEMYVKTLQERKHKLSRKSFLLGNLKKAAVIVGLVTLGILAGLAIKSESDNDTLGMQTIPNSASITPPDNNRAPSSTDESATDKNSLPVDNNQIVNNIAADNPEPLTPQVKSQMDQRQEKELLAEPRTKKEPTTPVERQQRYQEPQAAVEKDPVTGERSKRVRTSSDIVEDKQVPKTVMGPRKSGLESMVSVSSNDYKRVAFGGIRNLELTVTNDSKFVLDKVTVQLQYLKPSEETIKTELIQFRSVSPNGSMTMRIKDTNRGIKVSYKIIDIQSQHTETALRE